MKYHKNAKLSYEQREEIARRIKEGGSISKIAREFNITRRTIYKWAKREDFYDRSSRPKKFCKLSSTPTCININKDHIDF